MYRAAFLTYDYNNSAPSAKELKTYLGNSAKLLHGNDLRKSKNTPFPDKLHLINHSFSTFSYLFSPNDRFQQVMLYIFDDRINSTHFFLKYASNALCHFEVDDQIVDDMYETEWDYGHLTRHLKSVQSDLDSLDFFIQKKIGDNKFHKFFPSHISSSQKFIVKIENEIKKLETKATQLFSSGWS
jgi:hypothetical protein